MDRIDPQCLKALVARTAGSARRDPAALVERSERQLAADPNSALTWFALGLARLELHRYGQGVEALSRAIGLDVRFAHAAEEWARRGISRIRELDPSGDEAEDAPNGAWCRPGRRPRSRRAIR